MDELGKLQAIERELEREWWWLSGAVHAVAQINSGDSRAYVQMMTQKRIEIATRIAELVGPPTTD